MCRRWLKLEQLQLRLQTSQRVFSTADEHARVLATSTLCVEELECHTSVALHVGASSTSAVPRCYYNYGG